MSNQQHCSQSRFQPSSHKAAPKQGIPSNYDDFSPPGPPGNPNEWDLQFCKWWGWSWVRKSDNVNIEQRALVRKQPKPRFRLFSCCQRFGREREINVIHPVSTIHEAKSAQVNLCDQSTTNVRTHDTNYNSNNNCCECCCQMCRPCMRCCQCCCCCCEQEPTPKTKTCECQTPKPAFKTCECQTERQPAKDKCTECCAPHTTAPAKRCCCCQPVRCCCCRCAKPRCGCATTRSVPGPGGGSSSSRSKKIAEKRSTTSEKLLKQINCLIDTKLNNSKSVHRAFDQYYSKSKTDGDKNYFHIGDVKRDSGDKEHADLLTAVCDAILSNKQCELDRKLQNTTRANRRFLTNRMPLRNRSVLTKVYRHQRQRNDDSSEETKKQETAERNLETLLKSFNLSDFESLDMISPPSSMEEK